ncbi:uncharacterized protein crybg2 [Nerophis lumbriciformis]|uniref:uncharacterized protein crybg2 n=1 Tax=Nerophis lumbriciformis TaxID=546530 RepID=UPI002AE043F0|nr:uncharacterized protein LOC133621194 [Nerophis lumbriciformis]XP_061839136.1 uncharacterized protein LOC133621194 [Nerophis lumbriciformis]
MSSASRRLLFVIQRAAMARRTSTKKSLKSLFSRSEPNLDESTTDETKKPDDKKRFKLPKLKIKSIGSPSSFKASGKKQHVLSAAEPINSPADGPGWDNKTSTSIYATAPRSKTQELSYSETDLSKPKRFATFSFGLLKKRKKKKEENISRSSFGLHSPDVEEYDENHADFSQVDEDQARRNAKLSMSQPVLDTSDSFDIPSPPSIHSKLLESYFAASNRTPVTHTAIVEPREPLTSDSDFLLHHKAQTAPIATIPEMQQDDKVPSKDKDNVLVVDNQSESVYESVWVDTASLSEETAPKQEQTELSCSDYKGVNINSSATHFEDQSGNSNVSIAEPISAPLSYEADAPDAPFGQTPKSQPSLAYTDIDVPLLSEPVAYTEPVMVQQEDLFPHTEQSIPDFAEKVTKPSADEKLDLPVNRDAVYGALYESLFPQSFTSEIMSSLPTNHVETSPGTRTFKSEQVMIETQRDEHYPRLSTSSVTDRIDHAFTVFNEPRFSSYNTPTASEAQMTTNIPHSSSSSYSYSEVVDNNPYPVHIHADINSISFSPFEDKLIASNSAPPVSDQVSSQGTDTQVTDSLGRAIVVKEIVSNKNSADSGPSSSMSNDMTTEKGLRKKMDTAGSPPELTEGYTVPSSPVYLSVGSDVGSAMDIYYSAEEDSLDSLDEQTYIMDKIEERFLGPSRVTKFEEYPLEKETERTMDNVELHGGNKETEEVCDLQVDMHQLLIIQREEFQVPETGGTEFFKVKDESIEGTQFAAKALPPIKEEELLVNPVLQVKTQMVCEFAAPSSHPQGEGTRGNWIEVIDTAGTKPPSRDLQYLPDKDMQSKNVFRTDVNEEDLRTSEFKEKEERLSPTVEKKTPDVTRVERAITEIFIASTLMHNAELQSAAIAVEHKRAQQEREWVDTISESAEGNLARQEQVAVELSDLKANTHPPDREAPETLLERRQHPPDVPADLKPRCLAAASETSFSEEPKTNADQEPDDKMNTGYSSLSTTLSMRNAPPDQLNESRYGIRKVSLVRETGNAATQGTVDFNRAESNGTSLGSEYDWKNSIDSASRYASKREEPFDTLKYKLSDTSSSTYSSVLPEATSYSYTGSKTQSELAREPEGDWGRSSLRREESSAPADDPDASCFTGVFKATLVELDDPAASYTPPASPDTDASHQYDMETLKDTLKSMGPQLRPRGMGLRGPPPVLHSALPPIGEEVPSPVTSDVSSPTNKMQAGTTAEALNGIYTLPPNLGLKKSSTRDTRSPMELMKKDLPGTRAAPLSPNRASATRSVVMRQSSDDSNGQSAGSRLDTSVIFANYRSSSTDHKQENGKVHQPVTRTGSLPSFGSSSLLKELSEVNTTTDSPGSRFERLSFLMSAPPSSGFSGGADDLSGRLGRPSLQSSTTPLSSSLISPSTSLEHHRLFPTTESSVSKFGHTLGQGMGTNALGTNALGTQALSTHALGTQALSTHALSTPTMQRSFSHDSIPVGTQKNLPTQNNLSRGSQVQAPEPERHVKYRAFPDAYLTKEKEHGKLNPRPGKLYIFDRPGLCGQRIELHSDVVDATSWDLQETISIRVVRGGWVLYEKRNFKGEKIALDEGDIELTCPFNPPEEEQVNGEKQQNGQQKDEPSEEQTEAKPAKKFIIGSVRRAVRDYSVPEISLFPDVNAEGKKVIFRDTSEDARIFGFPIKANSIIINAGLWLVFAKPFFEGVPRVLEVGGYSNPEAWGVEQPYVGSLHPLKVGEPRVENISEPKIEIFERSYFTGRSRVITANMKDFMTRLDKHQSAFMYTAGSLKVHGGIWVGYEKEGFRGHQYLLEEGEYHDWRVWGGSNPELRSVRVIQADLSEPLMVMFEQPEEEQGAGEQEENTFEVTEAIPDVELFGYKTNTRSIQVYSGAWVAYSHVDFSGSQYILEKGFYSNSADWGSPDTRICSVQPIHLAPTDGNRTRKEILLYSEPDYKGDCLIFSYKQEAETENFQTKSCRVVGGSWVVYENKDFSGVMYVLSEGGYTSLASMGCTSSTFIRSVKAVPMTFSVPSISLFGLEGLEGREISTDSELLSMVGEGFNDHILSVRVNSGWWVLCEYSNYRGRQFLLEPIEITNWPKFSSLQTVGSMYPVKQKRLFFHIKNVDSGHFMSIQGGVEEMKSGRVVVLPEAEPMSDIWFYQDGLIKNKMSSVMSLQVIGTVEQGAKLVLWNDTRQRPQTWVAQMRGPITSIAFPGMVMDVKGGNTYDKDYVVIMPEGERQSQNWEIVLLN